MKGKAEWECLIQFRRYLLCEKEIPKGHDFERSITTETHKGELLLPIPATLQWLRGPIIQLHQKRAIAEQIGLSRQNSSFPPQQTVEQSFIQGEADYPGPSSLRAWNTTAGLSCKSVDSLASNSDLCEELSQWVSTWWCLSFVWRRSSSGLSSMAFGMVTLRRPSGSWFERRKIELSRAINDLRWSACCAISRHDLTWKVHVLFFCSSWFLRPPKIKHIMIIHPPGSFQPSKLVSQHTVNAFHNKIVYFLGLFEYSI